MRREVAKSRQGPRACFKMLQSISFHTLLSTANQFCLEKVEKGGAQPKVAPPKTLEGEFLNCEVNGVKCQALLDIAANRSGKKF